MGVPAFARVLLATPLLLVASVMEPQEFELYDLVQDPGETQNLYGRPQHQALQKELWNRMEQLQARIPKRKAEATA